MLQFCVSSLLIVNRRRLAHTSVEGSRIFSPLTYDWLNHRVRHRNIGMVYTWPYIIQCLGCQRVLDDVRDKVLISDLLRRSNLYIFKISVCHMVFTSSVGKPSQSRTESRTCPDVISSLPIREHEVFRCNDCSTIGTRRVPCPLSLRIVVDIVNFVTSHKSFLFLNK